MPPIFDYWMAMCFAAADGQGGGSPDETKDDKEPIASGQEPPNGENSQAAAADASKEEDSKDGQDRAEEDDKEDKSPTWARRRIDKLTKERWNERRAREQAESKVAMLSARLAALEDTLKKGGSGEPERLDEAAVEARAAQKAAETLAQMQFANDCNAIYEKGVARFRDFEERLETYKMIGGLTPEMVKAAMATDDPAMALYRLAADPDQAHEVRSLDPVKMAARMTKIVEKQRTRPTISKAPAPIEPARGGAPSAPFDPEKVSMDQFIKWREENSRSRRGGAAS